MAKIKYMVAIMGKDQPGIIAELTRALTGLNCNLEDVSMTILEDQFAMMLIVESSKKQETLEIALEKQLKKKKLSNFWKKTRLISNRPKHSKSAETWVVTAVGKDHVGIVAAVSAVLAKHKLNITDLNCKILPGKVKKVYALMLEVDIPRKISIKKLESAFSRLSKKLRIEISMRRFESMEF